MNNYQNDATQAEKLAVLHNDRVVRDTYHARAQADADAAGGRYAKLEEPTVLGASGGPVYPQQPEGSPWAGDPVPPEGPLGYSVDAMEPIEAARIPEHAEHSDVSSSSERGGGGEAPAQGPVEPAAAPPTSAAPTFRRRV